MPKQIGLRIFIDFSIEDKKIVDSFLKHFKLIKREFELDITTANDVRVGSSIKENVKKYIEEADIVIAMLSADYFYRGYDIRLKQYLSILNEKICPILVRPYSWENSIFKNYQILPIDRVPISLQENADAVFSEMIKEIVVILNSKEEKDFGEINQSILDEGEETNIKNLNPHDLYYSVLKKYEQATKKLFAFTFPFTEAFIKKILKTDVDFWDWIVKTSLIKKNEDDTFSLTIDGSSKLLKFFALNNWELMELAQDSINKYEKGVTTAEDVVNILRISLDYYKRLKHKSIENELIQIFNIFPFTRFSQLLNIRSIIDEISILIPSFSIPQIEKAKTYLQLSHAYTRLDKLDIAKKYAGLSLDINKVYFGQGDIHIADSYGALGNIYLFKGNYTKSILYYNKEFAIKENVLDKYDLKIAHLYMRMANPYIYTKCYDKAIQMFEKALKICDFQVNKKDADILSANIYGNISLVHIGKGNYDIALKYSLNDQLLKEKLFGRSHLTTGNTYETIGNIYYFQGRFEESLQFYQKVADIRVNSLGVKHPHTIDAKHNIATCYKGLKKYEKALELYHEVLDNTDTNNSNLSLYLDEIGKLYIKTKEYKLSLGYLEDALEVKHMSDNKEDDSNIAYSMDDIGYVCQLQGDLDIAMEKYEKSLAIKSKNDMENHPNTSITLHRMGEVFLLKEEYNKALEFFSKALHIRLEKLDETHIDTAKSYYHIAKTYRLKKDYPEAMLAEKEALKIYQKRKDKYGKIMCYTYYINNAIKAGAYQEEEFIQLLSEFLFILNRYASLNPNIWHTTINIFKKEETFDEEIAKVILQKLQNKKNFRDLMQVLGIPTFIKVQHVLEDEDVEDSIPTEKRSKKDIEAMLKRAQARMKKK